MITDSLIRNKMGANEMDAINCANLEKDCGRRGDEHYRDFGIWIRSRLDTKFHAAAHDSALAYQTALILLVNCLKSHDSSPRFERKLEEARGLQALVLKNLEMMSTHSKGIGA